MIFKKGYKLTLNRVHDVITVREGADTLKLTEIGRAHV